VPNLGIPLNDWTVVSVTAVTRRDVWADVSVNGDLSSQPDYLLHWNGSAWKRAAFSCGGRVILGVAPDGRRGVWLAAATSVITGFGGEWFCHRTEGHWTKKAVPKRAGQQPGIDELAWIPGTRSLWATGGFNADAGEVILKYGLWGEPRAFGASEMVRRTNLTLPFLSRSWLDKGRLGDRVSRQLWVRERTPGGACSGASPMATHSA
jgi:hypothetical protein